jgi:VWFA-related protein
MRLRVLVVLFFALALAPPSAPPQTPEDTQTAPPRSVGPTPPTFAVATESVVLDVVVRDKKGRMVRDLKASDFEVWEDGVRQTVDQFMVVSREPESAPPVASPPSASPPGTQEQSAAVEEETLQSPTIAQAPNAVIALVFDRLTPDGRNVAFQAARTYLHRERRLDDLVGVFSIDLALHTLQPFTTDRDLIAQGIDRAAGQAAAPFTSSRAQATEMRRLQSDVDQASNALTSAQSSAAGSGAGAGLASQARGLSARSEALNEAQVTLRMLRTFESMEHDQQGYATTNALQAIVDGLQALPGRKTIVFFSEGVMIPPNVQQQFRSVIHSANRANVSIYAMDAAGLRTESVNQRARDELQAAAEQRIRSLGREESMGILTRDMERTEDLLRLNPHHGLEQLAHETGGFLIKDTNDAASGFRQIGQDMRFHYVLGYAPSNIDFDGRFRSIEVKVRRSGVDVFSRRGYFGVKPGQGAPILEYEAPAVARLDLTPPPDSFPLRISAFSFPEDGRPGLVPVVVEVPATAFHYKSASEGSDNLADLTILVRISDESGLQVRRLSEHYLLSVPEESLDAARQGDILFYKEAELPPGRYTLEAVGYDAVADQATVRSSDVEVDFAEPGRLRVSSLMLVKKIEPLPADEQDPKKPFAFGEAMLYPNLGEPIQKSLNPAIGFFFRAYPPSSDAPLSARIEVVRDEEVIGGTTALLGSPDTDGRVLYASALPLDGFAPASYALKVTVTDGQARETRLAAFTIVE